jgi:hypothetical protein
MKIYDMTGYTYTVSHRTYNTVDYAPLVRFFIESNFYQRNRSRTLDEDTTFNLII